MSEVLICASRASANDFTAVKYIFLKADFISTSTDLGKIPSKWTVQGVNGPPLDASLQGQDYLILFSPP